MAKGTKKYQRLNSSMKKGMKINKLKSVHCLSPILLVGIEFWTNWPWYDLQSIRTDNDSQRQLECRPRMRTHCWEPETSENRGAKQQTRHLTHSHYVELNTSGLELNICSQIYCEIMQENLAIYPTYFAFLYFSLCKYNTNQ